MVIMRVSKSSEKAMLKTVRVLRRLLRNAFLVTNRVNVIGLLQRGQGSGHQQASTSEPTKNRRLPRHRQPARSCFVSRAKCSAPQNLITGSIVSRHRPSYKWRSSLGWDDKCHIM